MNLVEGVPTGGVGNEGLGLPSVGSTVKPSRLTWTPLRMLREADEEEVAIEAGLLDAAVVEDREGRVPDPQALGHALGRVRAQRDHLELQPRPVDARRDVAATVSSGAGGASPVPSDPDGPVTVSGGRVWAGGASPPSTTSRTFHRTITPSTAAPTVSQLERRVRPAEREHPREGRCEGVGRRTGA